MPVATGEMPGAWWSSFGDPVLDALIDGGVTHNVDLRIAAERVAWVASPAPRRHRRAFSRYPRRSRHDRDAARNGPRRFGKPRARGDTGSLISSGRLSAAVRAARADVAASAADAEAVRLLLIEEIARAYIDYRLQRAPDRPQHGYGRRAGETLRITRDRFEVGMASRLDIERAAALVSQTRSEHAVATEAADAARFRLSYLLSQTPAAISARLAGADAIPAADPLTVLRSPADVIAARPDVRMAGARYAASAARRDGTAAFRLPSLSLSGLVGLDGNGVGALLDGGTSIATIAASLVLPVLDFGRRGAELDAADSALRQSGLEYERAVRGALEKPRPRSSPIFRGQVRERELGKGRERSAGGGGTVRSPVSRGHLVAVGGSRRGADSLSGRAGPCAFGRRRVGTAGLALSANGRRAGACTAGGGSAL